MPGRLPDPTPRATERLRRLQTDPPRQPAPAGAPELTDPAPGPDDDARTDAQPPSRSEPASGAEPASAREPVSDARPASDAEPGPPAGSSSSSG